MSDDKEYTLVLNPTTEEEEKIYDDKKCLNLKPYMIKQFKITCCINTGLITTGFTAAWSAPMFSKLQSSDSPLPNPLTELEASWVSLTLFLGCLLGLLCSTYVSIQYGRRFCLNYASIFTFVGYILTLVGNSVVVLSFARVLCGLGTGAVQLVGIIYIGEIASPDIRGYIMTSTGISYVIGCMLAYCVGPFVAYSVVGYIGLLISALHIACGFYLPESPVYCTLKGDLKGAKRSLHELGRDSDIDVELQAMVDDLKVQHCFPADKSFQRNHLKSWLEILSVKQNRRAILTTIILVLAMNFSGAVPIVMFATKIFKNGHSSVNPNVCTIILGFTELLGMSLTPFTIERCGRKVMLLMSSAGCSVCMAILGSHFYLTYIEHPFANSLGALPLVTMIIFLLSYNLGLGIVPFVLIGEMMGPAIRNTGSTISTGCFFGSAFFCTLGFSYVDIIFGSYAPFWVCAVANACTFTFSLIFVKETKGKSLMEIQEMLH